MVYRGTTIDRYLNTVLHGISTAASVYDCNLLLACGMDAIPSTHSYAPAWPLLMEDATFVPVGPWNTDGLIVVLMPLNSGQERYLGDLADAGHPLVFTAFDGPGVSVNIDIESGVRQALMHLHAHGHERIAFIAGLRPTLGDSGIRLQAYLALTRAMGLASDPRLVAYGDLGIEGGRQAMREMLNSGVPFTAVLANNDAACLGAIQVLQERGLRVPEDVALIGFDDILDARAHVPPLTTVHHPAFTMGQQAVRTLLDVIAGHPPVPARIQLPVQLVVRHSCGCRLGGDRIATALLQQPAAASITALAHAMAEAGLLEARTGAAEVEALCFSLVTSFLANLQASDGTLFEDALLDVLQRVESLEDDSYAWLVALATLEHGLLELVPPLPASTRMFAGELLNRARQIVSERARQQTARALLHQEHLAARVGQMTSQLLATLELHQIEAILARHLPQLDIPHMLAALFVAGEDDPVAQSEPVLSYGLAGVAGVRHFSTRQFPPAELYPQERAFQLALLPLVAQEARSGFVAFDAANLEACGAIVRHLAAALRSSSFYAAALKADRLKTMLLTNVSHELRTPLNIILGYSQSAHKRLEHSDGTITSGLSDDLQHIYGNGEHLLHLINDLLDLSRADINELHLLPEPIELRSFLEALFEASVTSFSADSSAAWRLELPAELPPLVADPVRLRQVLLNLLHNAGKFTQRGQITLGAAVTPNELHLWVADTGVGIAGALQEQIFDPFVSVGDDLRRNEGIGLGLAITRRLVALHGGRIKLESQLGRGSTFHIYLPLPTPEVATALPKEGHQEALLLVTEAVEPPTSLVALAERRRLAIALLRPGDDLSGMLTTTRPALLVWDLRTALGSGLKLVEQVRAHAPFAQLPLMLYQSGLDVAPNAAGATTGVLLKPLGEGALIEALRDFDLRAPEGSILIVEDDSQTRALHRRMIAEHFPTYTLRDVGDGRSALELCAQETPSLLVLDLMMPGVDGFAVLAALRAEPRTAMVPVLVLSGKALAAEDVRRLGEARVIFQTKDVLTNAELAEALRRTMLRDDALSPHTSALVKQAIGFIQDHHSEAISLQQIADVLGVNKDYFGQIFHQELGLSPWEYLLRYRVLRAKELLRATNYSVTEVAARVGFDTLSYFSRIFRREVGCSPRAFRTQSAHKLET